MTHDHDHDHDHAHTHPHAGFAAGAQQRLASRHEHIFLGADHQRNARKTWAVIAITAVMMVAEISAGTLFGSMALLADGWHMATHAGAILISALAYRYALKNVRNERFTFGTGKFGDLAAFSSAIVLAMVALLIGWESIMRFRNPVPIDFSEAIAVAVLGLVVNLVCAWLLWDDHDHHGASHGHHHGHHDHAGSHTHHGDHANETRHAGDSNLRAAYVHVLADALTSVLAIAGLFAGSFYGWLWLDPMIGLVGTVIIGRWAYGLMRDAGGVLLDYVPGNEDLPDEIRAIIEPEGAVISDLHVWQLGPGHHGAIVSLTAVEPRAPSYYRDKLARIPDLSHVTVEVERVAAA